MITSREQLKRISQDLKAKGRVVGFTSGTFDIIHGGHVSYLNQAKQHCDVLIVGVNSDQSVKSYKSPKRPIISQENRLLVIDSLRAVDYAFIFDEPNNHKNIELLKPNVYLKAGDYSIASLSSAPIVKRYGGKIKIIPFKKGLSTTTIIDQIIDVYGVPQTSIPLGSGKKCTPQPTVFLDRDGTINEEVEYLHQADKFVLLDGAIEGMSLIQALGYKLAIITTQAGIGLGYFGDEDFYRVNRELLKACQTKGIVLDKIYYCPHSKGDNCACRKPGIALIQRGEKEIPADLTKSILIGDKTSDIKAGQNAGLYTILVRTGHGGQDGEFEVSPDHIANNLKEAATHIQTLAI